VAAPLATTDSCDKKGKTGSGGSSNAMNIKPEVNDMSIADAADGSCDGLPKGTERWINCDYTIKTKGGVAPKHLTKGCSVRPDPTTHQGCITPRMKLVLGQVKAQHFGTHGIGCFRHDDHGEHPRGRACDIMMTDGGKAKGDSKKHGDRLAHWAVDNADSLGIMYVIWYYRIWTRSEGWHAYNNPYGGNDPSGWHTNHVHISVLS
jgi:hypothetical protein